MANAAEKLNFFRNLTFLQWASIVLTFIAGLLGLSMAVFNGPPSPWAFGALVLTVSTAIITDRINRHIFENETTIALEREMNSPFDLKYLGSSSDGTNWLSHNCVGPTIAYNTVFNRTDDGDLIPDELKQYCAAIQKSLTNGCSWTDFFLPGGESIIDDFAGTLDEKQRPRYTARRLHATAPLLQFLILRQADQKTSVLFGWGFKSCTQSAVFFTDNSRTADYFLNYARQLLQTAEPYIERGVRQSAAPKPVTAPSA